MNCLEFRRAIGTDPRSLDEAADIHRSQCSRCGDALQRALAFERTLGAAFAVPVPQGLADRVLLAQTTAALHEPARRRWPALALAATIVLSVALGAGFGWRWFSLNAPLADLAIAHLAHEPFALSSRALVAEAEVRGQFAALGAPLQHAPGAVHYLMNCPLGRHRVVHMVLQRESGPVTALYVPRLHEARREFGRDGVRGREQPLAGGTLILLATSDREFDAVAAQFRGAFGGSDSGALGTL
ncbi:MAG: DUF3379 family protein [Xanthomonadales bacterium]|nr:DUF3379 family protein [Xanthomonadales bacterium]